MDDEPVDQYPNCSEALFDGGLRLGVSIQTATISLADYSMTFLPATGHHTVFLILLSP